MAQTQTCVGMSLLEDRVYTGIQFQACDSESRLWLQEHVFGILVPTLQELIKEIQKTNPDDHTEMVMHNCIDWLASLLMRNNPKHNSTAALHPYNLMLQEHVRKTKLSKLFCSTGMNNPSHNLPTELLNTTIAEDAFKNHDNKKTDKLEKFFATRSQLQKNDCEKFLDWLQSSANLILNLSMLRSLYDDVVSKISDIFDSVAVYICDFDRSTGTLTYSHASQNCSTLLRSGVATLSQKDHPNAPSFQVLKHTDRSYHLSVKRVSSNKNIAIVGDYPSLGEGDLFIGKILNDLFEPVGLFLADTLSCNQKQQISAEELVLFGSNGAQCEYRPLDASEQLFFQKVVTALSSAYSNFQLSTAAEFSIFDDNDVDSTDAFEADVSFPVSSL